jgi:S-phase kinase-associated protein 1
MVKLVTKDNVTFEIDENVANKFQTVKNLIDDIGDRDPIPLPEIDEFTFKKILEYALYHLEHPVVVENEEFVFSDWDTEFFKLEHPVLISIVISSNYLDYKELLDMSVQAIASIINGKTPEEIRTLFDIVSDFTPEEEEAIRKENEWLEE